MWLPEPARKTIRHLALGPENLPNQCIIGMEEPQSEVDVELHGLGAPRDVTQNHVPACAAPFTIGIGFDQDLTGDLRAGKRVALHFRERAGARRLLGKLRLRLALTIPVAGRTVGLFSIRNTSNYCLPRMRLWARYAYWAYGRLKSPPDVRLKLRDVHAMPVLFSCPRPVVLVSVADGKTGNIFPMNLMGSLGDNHFGLALNSTRPASALVQRLARLALSSLPVEQASLVRSLGANHKKESIRLDEIPFSVAPSPTFGLPVPTFALRVRELEVITTRNMGSHMLFIARVVHDERWSNGLEYFMVHGIYQAWRLNLQGSHASPAAQSAF
jgi:flavin reductase (DIM6/NTAB) family NADH-FMN oxidoreductase RutF